MRYWLLRQVARCLGLRPNMSMRSPSNELVAVLLSRTEYDAALMFHTVAEVQSWAGNTEDIQRERVH
jgi:hypothetical protein